MAFELGQSIPAVTVSGLIDRLQSILDDVGDLPLAICGTEVLRADVSIAVSLAWLRDGAYTEDYANEKSELVVVLT